MSFWSLINGGRFINFWNFPNSLELIRNPICFRNQGVKDNEEDVGRSIFAGYLMTNFKKCCFVHCADHISIFSFYN